MQSVMGPGDPHRRTWIHVGRLAATIPDIQIPAELVEAVTAHPAAGVDAACAQILALRDTGAFAGVHLVPVSRFRQVAARLEQDLKRDSNRT